MYYVFCGPKRYNKENVWLVRRELAIALDLVPCWRFIPYVSWHGQNRQWSYFEIYRQHETYHPLSRVNQRTQ